MKSFIKTVIIILALSRFSAQQVDGRKCYKPRRKIRPTLIIDTNVAAVTSTTTPVLSTISTPSATTATDSATTFSSLAPAYPTATPSSNQNWRDMADKVVSVFENGSPSLHFDYCENIGDGRGYTAGYRGFTTAQDAVEVLDIYRNLQPQSVMSKYCDTLRKLSKSTNADTSSLSDFCNDWKSVANEDPLFQKAQQEWNNKQYWEPAMKLADEHVGKKIKPSPLTYLIFYDTMVQHGLDDDPVGVGAKTIINETNDKMQSYQGSPKDWEMKYLETFLNIRRRVLSSSSDVWKESVTRIDALEYLVSQKNVDLTSPLKLPSHVYNELIL